MKIKEIYARYIGDIIPVNSNYNIDDVVVTVYYYDGTKEEIKHGFYVGNTLVKDVGLNSYYAFYKGFQSLFCVRGVLEQNLKDIAIRRTNESKLTKGTILDSGTEVTKEDLDAHALYRRSKPKDITNNNDFIIHNTPLADGITTYTKPDENGIIKKYSDYCEYSKIKTSYIDNNERLETVVKTFAIPTKYKFENIKAWYEGPAVPEDKKPDFNDIRIYMKSHLGNTLSIPTDFTGISFERVGVIDSNHIVKVVYTSPDRLYKLQTSVRIPVMKADTISDIEFKVIYVPDNDLDVTEQFSDAMYVNNTLFVSWNKFYDIVKQTEKYGPYIIDVPKLSGLDSVRDQRWLVTVSPSALKASIIKNL